jgi:hypothetical protein
LGTKRTFAAREEAYLLVAHFHTNSKAPPFARFLNVETGAEFVFQKESA